MKAPKTTRKNDPTSKGSAESRTSKKLPAGLAIEPPAPDISNPAQLQQEAAIQMQELEEEELMAKPEGEQIQMQPEEEELMMKPEGEGIQMQAEEEELMMKPAGEEIQMQPEEEELMMKPEGEEIQMQPEEEELMMKPEGEQIQMQGLEEEELMQGKFKSPVQKKAEPGPNGLPGEVNERMESTLGADFSGVKIHPDSSKAPAVGAAAYTQGSDIHFAPGQFKPETSKGQALLGHELTHVVQQKEGRVEPTTEVNGMPVNDNPGLEKEADELGKKAAS